MIKALGFLILFSTQVFAQPPPPREYPYPPAKTNEDLGLEKPKRVDQDGAYYYGTDSEKSTPKPYEGIEQPYRIGEDGAYYYDEDKKSPSNKPYKGVEQPIEQEDDGSYYYSEDDEPEKPTVTYGPKPSKVKEDGSYIYDLDIEATTNTLSIRAGIYGPPKIEPVSESGENYESVYGDSSEFVFALDYDWKLFNQVYVKFGTGISSSQGKGQFAGGANDGIEPKENFQFYVFPTTLSLAYKFQLWDIQYLTPYIEGGVGYFGFMETRSDGDNTKFGGAPVLSTTGGLLISLTQFQEGTTMYTEYGISQTWFDLQFKQILGLDARKDFTSNMITGGFAVGF